MLTRRRRGTSRMGTIPRKPNARHRDPRMTLRLPSEIVTRLKTTAATKGTSVNQLIIDVLENSLPRNDETTTTET